MDNFSNRNQTCAALVVDETGDHVVFHASVRCQVRQLRIIFPEAISSHATNHVTVQIERLRGANSTNIGDAVGGASAAITKGQIFEVVDFDSDRLELEKGDSLVASCAVAGTGEAQLSVAVDAEIIGSR